MRYIALIHRDDPDAKGAAPGFGFTIPDLPGFAAHADLPMVDAVDEAERVLADHIAAMVDADRAVPAPRDIQELERDPDVKAELDEAEAFVVLNAIFPAGRTVRVNITMDEATLAEVDRAAKKRNLTRSAFIAEASRRMALDPAAVWDTESFTDAHFLRGALLSNLCMRVATDDDHAAAAALFRQAFARHLADDGRPITSKIWERMQAIDASVEIRATNADESGASAPRGRRGRTSA